MSRFVSPAYAALQRAPFPSPALLAMQQKGLELSGHESVSPIPNVDPHLRLSPLSILSTPSSLDPDLQNEDMFCTRRKSSLASIETTVSGILNLYTNLSQRSLRSEYEEVSPIEDSDEENDINHTVHQPKAYRDTIAPLLKYQFKSEMLAAPPVPSPMSVASLPQIQHPAYRDIPPLRLTPSPDIQGQFHSAGLSQTSIQITPEMTPPPTVHQPAVPSFQEYSAKLRERKVALEVSDVRDAGSWYDQPLSPVSPEDNSPNLVRASHYSAVSPEEMMGHQTQLTYDALVPLAAAIKPSPQMQAVTFGHQDFSEPMEAGLTVDMLPAPLHLTHSRSISKISEGSAPVHTTEVSGEGDYIPKSQHASLVTQDPIEGSMQGYLTPSMDGPGGIPSTKSNENLLIEENIRLNSAFSDDSSEGELAGFGDQFKNAFKFGKKKKKVKNSKDLKVKKSRPDQPPDDIESYKFSYWKGRSSPALQEMSEHRKQSPAISNGSRRGSALSGPGPSVSSSPQPMSSLRPQLRRYGAQQAVPLTDFQLYGPEIYDPKMKEERLRREAKEAKAAEKEAKKQAKVDAKAGKHHTHDHFERSEEFRTQNPQAYDYFKSRPASSRAYSHMRDNSIENASRPSSDAGSVKSIRKPNSAYNNDLFELSGGKKKSSVMSRLLMSSEERRRQTIKKSITVVGGGRISMERSKTNERTS